MPKLIYRGPSHDERTNQWKILCDCGEYFSPATTMFSVKTEVCPYCGREFLVNYTKETVDAVE